MKRVTKICLAAVAFIAATLYSLVAFAQAVIVDPLSDPIAFFNTVKNAIANKQWGLVAAIVVVGLVAFVRWGAKKGAVAWAGKWAGKACAFLTTDRGGILLTLITGVATSLASVFVGGVVTVQTVFDGVMLGITAAGGYVAIKKLIWPSGADTTQTVAAIGAAAGAKAAADAANDPAAALNAVNKKPE